MEVQTESRKEALLAQVHKARARFDAALDAVSDARKVSDVALYDKWTVKDLIAHIAYWERRVVWVYGMLAEGQTPDSITDFDAVNEQVWLENRERPLEDIVREEEAAYRDLLMLIEVTDEDDLFNPALYDWGGGYSMADRVAGNSFDHYDEHLDDLAPYLDSL